MPPLELRNQSAGGSLMAPFDKAFFEELWDMFFELVKETETETSFLGFEILNATAMLRKKQTETAFANRGKLANIINSSNYKSEETNERVARWCLDVRDKVDREFERRKGSEGVDETTRLAVGRYANYDGESVPFRTVGNISGQGQLMESRVWKTWKRELRG